MGANRLVFETIDNELVSIPLDAVGVKINLSDKSGIAGVVYGREYVQVSAETAAELWSEIVWSDGKDDE